MSVRDHGVTAEAIGGGADMPLTIGPWLAEHLGKAPEDA